MVTGQVIPVDLQSVSSWLACQVLDVTGGVLGLTGLPDVCRYRGSSCTG